MTSIAKMTPDQLRRREAAILAELREAEPALMLELEAVQAQLQRIAPAEGPYSDIREVREAAELLLREQGCGMSKRDIATALVKGGFYKGKKMGRYLIRDSINHHKKKGRFVEIDGLIYLPEHAPAIERR